MEFFNSNYKDKPSYSDLEKKIESLREELKQQTHFREEDRFQYDIYKQQVAFDKSLVQKQHEFELDTFESKQLMSLKDKLNTLEKDYGVIEKELEMANKLLNVDNDIVDVKELITEIMKKIPEIRISDVSLHTNVTTQTSKE